jgi:hypothetical protein
MIFPRRIERKLLNSAQTLSNEGVYEIERKFWLEAIILTVSVTSTAAATTPTTHALHNLVQKVALEVNEGAEGTRAVVNAAGISLVEWARQCYGFDSRVNVAGYQNAMSSAGTYTIVIPIFLRHPLVSDPHGTKLCLPLQRYGSNPQLKITLGAVSDVANTLPGVTTASIEATFISRDVTDANFPHWRSELVTDNLTWNAGTDVQYQFPAGGFLTGFLHQGFTDSTYRTGGAVLNSTSERWKVMWKDRTWADATEATHRAIHDFGNVTFGSSVYTSGPKDFANSFYSDFMADMGLFDVFSLASVADVTPETLRGNYLKLIAGLVGSTKYGRLTRHKLLVSPEELISAKM